MGSIAQKQIFSWKNIENIGDLERLKLVLDYTPDEKIISILEKERKNGRDKYPIEPMWNFRGQAKMQMRCGLALCIMLTLAYGRIKEDQKGLMRSLVKAAS